MSNVKNFGAIGDGKTDDTEAILHAIAESDQHLIFPQGTYVISKSIEIDLKDQGPLAISGDGGTARIVMKGAGPALKITGTHGGTGDPGTHSESVWKTERFPTISNLEIAGEHPQADGIYLTGTVQATISSVLIRKVRHAIHLHKRNRNVLIDQCHLYFNTGVGIFMDQVNLHQIIISSNHISYNRLGGIRIEGSEIRNLQITGNDIEYNNHAEHGTDPEPTAELFIDTTAETASVAEITVASNTIQATPSPGGANIRIHDRNPKAISPRLWTITGNIIGSQVNNVHLVGCHGVVLSGNCIYSCENRNLLVEDSSMINVTGNNFRRHTPRLGTGVRFENSTDCIVSGCQVLDEAEEGQASGASLLELENCNRMTISGSQFIDGVPVGIDVNNRSHVSINGCTISDRRGELKSTHAIRFRGKGTGNRLDANTITETLQPAIVIADSTEVKQ